MKAASIHECCTLAQTLSSRPEVFPFNLGLTTFVPLCHIFGKGGSAPPKPSAEPSHSGTTNAMAKPRHCNFLNIGQLLNNQSFNNPLHSTESLFHQDGKSNKGRCFLVFACCDFCSSKCHIAPKPLQSAWGKGSQNKVPNGMALHSCTLAQTLSSSTRQARSFSFYVCLTAFVPLCQRGLIALCNAITHWHNHWHKHCHQAPGKQDVFHFMLA